MTSSTVVVCFSNNLGTNIFADVFTWSQQIHADSSSCSDAVNYDVQQAFLPILCIQYSCGARQRGQRSSLQLRSHWSLCQVRLQGHWLIRSPASVLARQPSKCHVFNLSLILFRLITPIFSSVLRFLVLDSDLLFYFDSVGKSKNIRQYFCHQTLKQ